MDVQVNWLAILVATVVAMLIGNFWYSKTFFGKQWIKLTKVDEEKAKKAVIPAMVAAVLSALVTAYVLAHVSYLSNQYFKNDFTQDALTTAFFMWLGFQATLIVMHDAFEQRPMKLTALNLGNQFVTLIAMGLVIGLMGV